MKLQFKNSFLQNQVLPPVIRSASIGTWAHDTMSRRIVEEIFPRIIDDNEQELSFPSSPLRFDCLLQLNDLKESLKCGSTGYLRPILDNGIDTEDWNIWLSELDDNSRNWLTAPWMISECYFYRRVVEAFRYCETGYDMFAMQKANGLFSSKPSIEMLSNNLQSLSTQESNSVIELGLLTSLWGNKMDLSLWPSSSSGTTTSSASTSSSSSSLTALTQTQILDNHLQEVVDYIQNLKKQQLQQRNGQQRTIRIDIVVDNAGYELVSDMFLAVVLLQQQSVDQVVFHCKAYPTFVSDATIQDVLETVEFLPDPFATLLRQYLTEEKILLQNDPFWCSPLAMWDMPDHIREDFQTASSLVVIKGDANYRRLLGDRQWPWHFPAKSVLSYWPCPIVALRMLKAEVACGITSDMQEKAQNIHFDWMVNGKWAVVQFYNPKSSI
jgi:hypothetical protein